MAAEEYYQQLHTSKVDVIVSYLLLVGALVLDVSSLTIFILSYRFPARISYVVSYCCIRRPACCKKQWSEELGQYNMISSAGMHATRVATSWPRCNMHTIQERSSAHQDLNP